VITDCSGRLRDAKHPTIGPIELNVPGTSNLVALRYLYDGNMPAARETFRNTTDGKPKSPVNYSDTKAETTRFAPAISGGSSMFLMDDDGTVDALVTDRSGMPWFTYRAREGMYTVPAYPNSPDKHPDGHFLYGPLERPVSVEFRGTGMVDPPELPMSAYLDYAPWYVRVLEGDFLMGRRGVAGWNGQPRDLGFWLPVAGPSEETQELSGFLGFVKSYLDWQLGGYMALYHLVVGLAKTAWEVLKAGVKGFQEAWKYGWGAAIMWSGMRAGWAFLQGLIAPFRERLEQGQSWWQVGLGGVLDIVGISGLFAGATNIDLVTWDYLGLSSEDRAYQIGMGAVQLGGTLYGGYQGFRQGRAWYLGKRLFVESGPRMEGFSPRRLILEMQESKVGRETIRELQRLHPTHGKVQLDYLEAPLKNGYLTRGEYFPELPDTKTPLRLTKVYARNTRTLTQTAQTVIHETVHASGIRYSQWAEFQAYYKALQHVKDPTMADIGDIVSHVIEAYPWPKYPKF